MFSLRNTIVNNYDQKIAFYFLLLYSMKTLVCEILNFKLCKTANLNSVDFEIY